MSSCSKQIATSICKTLFEHGFIAYFAGGWVRDLLLGVSSDEIDIATSAPPDVIQKLFPKTLPVGVAFGVVVVVMRGINFEVTTFRKDLPYIDGRHPSSVDFSNPEKDAQRRDFTINGMFWDPLTDTLHDYVGGKEDLKQGIIRAIGEPIERFQEDRLRMLRAVRFSARFDFPIEARTGEAIKAAASTLFPAVSAERVWQELTKMAKGPHFDRAILLLHTLTLLHEIFPSLSGCKQEEIEKRIAPFPYFPPNTHPFFYLMELFPGGTQEEFLALCTQLKTSNFEKKLAQFCVEGRSLLMKNPTPYEWALFYAHPLCPSFLAVETAKHIPPTRASFAEEHERRQKKLHRHIHRLQTKDPVVTSHHLKKLGIAPGKQMGALLKQAEELSVNLDVHDAPTLLTHLRL